MNPLLAISLAGALSITSHTLRWLTGGGAFAAAMLGAIIFTGGGPAGASLLAVFFISGSVLTRISSGKQPARTGRQVFANGTCAALGAALLPTSPVGWPLLAGALTAAQADTWATEIGRFSKRKTRLITTGSVVEPGTSGGVTFLGTGGGLFGAAAMGGLAALLGVGTSAALAAVAGGVVGFVVDSLLGATLQATYRCDVCAVSTEFRVHSCGGGTRPIGGWAWLDNDAVNFVSVSLGGVIALALWFLA